MKAGRLPESHPAEQAARAKLRETPRDRRWQPVVNPKRWTTPPPKRSVRP